MEYFKRNFAWHAITQYTGDVTCNCENSTIMYLKPTPDASARDRLGLMVLRSTFCSTFLLIFYLMILSLFLENDLQFKKRTRNYISILFRFSYANFPCR